MSRLADPRIMMSLKNLSLAAKATVEGGTAGIHSSTARGSGMEFSQYRSYGPGDDLRLLDWKMFARSDRYYIREAQVDASISVNILLDASASMNHADNGFPKIEYARYLAACLAYLGVQQGDAVGVSIFQKGNFFSVPAKKGPQQLPRIFHQLETAEPEGTFTEPAHYKSLFAESGSKGLVIFLTDFYEEHEEISRLLESLSRTKNEVLAFHLLAGNEITPDVSGYSSVQDWETGKRIQIDSSFREQYQNRLEQFLQQKKEAALSKQVWYELVLMNEPVHTAIQQFLNRRNKLLR